MKGSAIQIFLIGLLIFGNLGYCQANKSLSAYPNPTTGFITIEFKFTLYDNYDLNVDSKIEIFSSIGELLLSKPINVNISSAGIYTFKSDFNLDGYSSGVYIVRLYLFGDYLVKSLLLKK